MKKNKMMRMASALLVLVLLTTCIISGTFAKYTTSTDGSDSARVAKWGITAEIDGGTFAKTYEADDTSFTLAENTVVSSENVVAPGTEGELGGITLEGTPEVAFRVEYDATLTLENWEDADGAYYCPIVITVGDDDFDGANYTSADAFVAAVEEAIEDYSADYEAGTDISADDVKFDVSWAWPFSTSDDNDVKDTFLGDEAADNNAATIELELTATITQID